MCILTWDLTNFKSEYNKVIIFYIVCRSVSLQWVTLIGVGHDLILKISQYTSEAVLYDTRALSHWNFHHNYEFAHTLLSCWLISHVVESYDSLLGVIIYYQAD